MAPYDLAKWNGGTAMTEAITTGSQFRWGGRGDDKGCCMVSEGGLWPNATLEGCYAFYSNEVYCLPFDYERCQ